MAFRLLSLSLAEHALNALETLLTSTRGSDLKAGIQAWRAIFRLGADEDVQDAGLPQQIFNILNVRGEVPAEVLTMANPMKVLRAAPQEKEE